MSDKKDSKQKKDCWLKTTAGKISIWLFLVAVFFLLIGCHFACCDNISSNNVFFNAFLGLATNLLGIIVTVSFVQHFLDKQERRKERKEEAEKILRYNRVMQLYISDYTKYFNLVVTPQAEIKNCHFDSIKEEFAFRDMRDLHQHSLLEDDPFFGETIVALFFKAETYVRDFVKIMIENIDFSFYSELHNELISFVSASMKLNVKRGILENENLFYGTGTDRKKAIDEISKDIADDDKYHWVETLTKGDRTANVMGPYVKLYLLLEFESKFIKKYNDHILMIQEEYKRE